MPVQIIQKIQVEVYMNARAKGLTQVESAAIAGFSERSGQRIEAGDHQPNRGRLRDWRTSPDPLAGVWENELEPILKREPRLKPMTLFEYLQDHYPGQYPQVLRTLQRRVQTWKALHGPAPEVMFELRHEPGMMGISDFTELKGVEVTIAGQPFEHLLYHYRLAYSGWQYAQVIQGGESFIALSEGLQNAVDACGGAPKQHRTDSLSAAYRNMGGKRHKPLTRLYHELCDHYRLQPTRNNTGIAHENGAIESPHGHLKNRIVQALYLRGSFDFASVAQYQALVDEGVAKLNRQCQAKFEAEQKVLQSLPRYRVPDYEVLSARVSRHSTIDVRCVLYTVPSRLIGRQIELHLYHDRIVGYLGQQPVVELPRIRVTEPQRRRARCINYRHVIDWLHRKPRAFLYCTWQLDLLPNDQWRQLWQHLQAQFDLDPAARLMVEALVIAAAQDKECAVAAYLEQELQAQTLSLTRLKQQFQPRPTPSVPEVQVEQHDLSSYDQLLSTRHTSESLPEPQSAPQTPAPVSYAPPLGKPGTASHAGTVVLCTVLAGTMRLGGQSTLDSSGATRTQRSPTAQWKNVGQLRVVPRPSAQSSPPHAASRGYKLVRPG